MLISAIFDINQVVHTFLVSLGEQIRQGDKVNFLTMSDLIFAVTGQKA